MDTELGDKIGYAIRFEDVTGPNTIIKVSNWLVVVVNIFNNGFWKCHLWWFFFLLLLKNNEYWIMNYKRKEE